MTIQQLKKELAGIREMLKPADEFGGGVIIYDPDQGIPEFNDGKTRICLPHDGRDKVLVFLPDNKRDRVG
jgi:hypothetical protein